MRVTRPESGGSAPTISRSSVDLPPPLRPTTPMRSPSATPSETPSRTTVRPVGLADVLEVDEVGHQATTCARRAPGRSWRRARRHTPSASQRGGEHERGASSRHRKAQVGPGAGDDAGRAPRAARPASRGRPARARSASAAGCRSLASTGATRVEVAVPRARPAARRAAGAARGARPAARMPVEFAVGVAGRDAEVGEREHPVQPAGAGTGVEDLAAPGAEAVPPSSGNAASLPSCGGQRQQFGRRRRRGPRAGRRRAARRRASAEPPAMPAGDRDRLAQVAGGRRARCRRSRRAGRRPARPGSPRRSGGRRALARRPSATGRRPGRATTSSIRSTAWKTVTSSW